MEKDLDNSVERGEVVANTEESGAANTNRRRFTRNAIVGSAVMLTLGNRAAWGDGTGGDAPVQCVSTPTLLSYRAFGENFSSAHPQAMQDDIKDFENLSKQTNKYREVSEADETCLFEKD